LSAWLSVFALTLGVELVVAFPLLRLIEPAWRVRIRLIVVANVLTHPFVYFAAEVASRLPMRLFAPAVFALELSACAIEAAVYARAFRRREWLPALFTSFFANAASLAASLCLAHVVSRR
jgi:hypothetical protein